MSSTLKQLETTLRSRKHASADDSYVASLYNKGTDGILKKIGEEATELVMAAKEGKNEEIIHETADLWFHTLVLLSHLDLNHEDVLQELQRRQGRSGHEEKASRGK